jgi:hypothetical protein
MAWIDQVRYIKKRNAAMLEDIEGRYGKKKDFNGL